jgi:Uma2 family endonuclease
VDTKTHEVMRRRFTVHDYHRMGEAGILKLPLYARSGIREVWIVDLSGETVERHADPSANGYRRVDRARRGWALVPLAFPGLSLRVDDILG